jgi:hypothetical protein
MRIITAWQHISLEETLTGVEKYCISSAMDENDDDVLWNGSEEDRDVCPEEEGIDCEVGESDTNF